MAVVTPLNNFLGPEGDTVTVDKQLLNTEYSERYSASLCWELNTKVDITTSMTLVSASAKCPRSEVRVTAEVP